VPSFSSQGIFLSYRREDAAPHASALKVLLEQHIPDADVFMDLDSIKPGVDFAKIIRKAVDSCAVLVALIGPKWAMLLDERAADDSTNPDYVRFEVQAALKRGVPVIPVLVDGAKPLQQRQLPSELQKLARLNALELSSGRYQDDADQLLNLIQKEVKRKAREAKRKAQKAAKLKAQKAAKRKAREAAKREAREAAKREAWEAADREAQEAAARFMSRLQELARGAGYAAGNGLDQEMLSALADELAAGKRPMSFLGSRADEVLVNLAQADQLRVPPYLVSADKSEGLWGLLVVTERRLVFAVSQSWPDLGRAPPVRRFPPFRVPPRELSRREPIPGSISTFAIPYGTISKATLDDRQPDTILYLDLKDEGYLGKRGILRVYGGDKISVSFSGTKASQRASEIFADIRARIVNRAD
jgi:hypothetical protein